MSLLRKAVPHGRTFLSVLRTTATLKLGLRMTVHFLLGTGFFEIVFFFVATLLYLLCCFCLRRLLLLGGEDSAKKQSLWDGASISSSLPEKTSSASSSSERIILLFLGRFLSFVFLVTCFSGGFDSL